MTFLIEAVKRLRPEAFEQVQRPTTGTTFTLAESVGELMKERNDRVACTLYAADWFHHDNCGLAAGEAARPRWELVNEHKPWLLNSLCDSKFRIQHTVLDLLLRKGSAPRVVSPEFLDGSLDGGLIL